MSDTWIPTGRLEALLDYHEADNVPLTAQDLRLFIQAQARVIPSRSTDPATSKAAEPLPIRAGTQRHRLLEAFGREAALDGLTDEEAADLADGVPYRSEFAKRCSELREAGHIAVVEGVTRPGVAGHQRIVSRITTLGRSVLEGLEQHSIN